VLPDASLIRIGGNGGTLNMNGRNDSVAGLSSVQVSDSTVLTNGTVNGAGTLTITGSGTYEFGGSYSPNSNGSLIMNGTGTQIFSGTGDNVGGWATVNSGTLVLAKASSPSVHAIGASNTTGLTINENGTAKIAGTGGDQIYIETHVTVNGTLDLGGLNEGFRGIAGSGTITNSVPETTSVLTIGQNSVNSNRYTFDGEFVNGAVDALTGINKVGLGTLVLTGNSTHTGFTDVTNGLLVVDGSISDSEVYVMDAAVLAGNGSLGENLTVSTGGGLGTELLDWDGPAGTGYSDLSITGSISFGGGTHTILVNSTSLSNFTESDRVFSIATTTGGITGFNDEDFTVNAINFPGNGTWTVRVTGNTLELVYAKAVGYAAWVGTYDLSGSNAEFDYDYDGDGIDNGLEFVLGGDPTLANDVTIPMPVLTGSGASRTATIEYPRRSISAYLNPVLELSDNLDAWNTAVNGANGASIVVTPNFYATGLDKVSVTLPAEGSRGFARISVTNP
jgi:autotransporter-associated beta strand protein